MQQPSRTYILFWMRAAILTFLISLIGSTRLNFYLSLPRHFQQCFELPSSSAVSFAPVPVLLV